VFRLRPVETGYRRSRMRGRFVSLTVVIVLVVSPLARAMCEVSCVDVTRRSDSAAHVHRPQTAATHDHHSVRHDSHPEAAVAVLHGSPGVSASACCADVEARLTSVAVTKRGIEAPAVSVSFFTVVDHRARDSSMVMIRSATPAAGPPSLKTPLRV
jgi:hypothetical protein